MQYTSYNHKNMEYRMHISFFLKKVVEQRTYRIAYSSKKQKNSTAVCYKCLYCKYHAPSHHKITYCGKFTVFFYIY